MARKQAKGSSHFEDKMKRRSLLVFLVGLCVFPALPSSGKTKKQNPYDEKRLLEQNKRIQRENNVPDEFPNFVREGFTVKVVTPDNYVTRDSGLVLWDVVVGQGDCPKDGQQVTFHYVGYNESGRRIDSTYLQGSPAKVRLGTNALIPGDNWQTLDIVINEIFRDDFKSFESNNRIDPMRLYLDSVSLELVKITYGAFGSKDLKTMDFKFIDKSI